MRRSTFRSALRCAAAILASVLSLTVIAADLVGTVVAVADGDTLTVLVDRHQVKVRLAEIDAPESHQAFGRVSRQSLADICHLRDAIVTQRDRDRYGRIVAQVTCAGVDANAEQVKRGMAWVYRRYAPENSPLYALEQAARDSHTGLWADSSPVPPWDFRRAAKPANP